MYTMLNYPIGSTVLAFDCFTTLFTYISLNTIYHDDDDDGDDAYITSFPLFNNSLRFS